MGGANIRQERHVAFIQLLSADFYYLMLAKIDTQCSENFLHQNKRSDDTEQWCAENYPLVKRFAPPTTSVALFGQIEQNCHIKHQPNSYSDVVVYCEDRRFNKVALFCLWNKHKFSLRDKNATRDKPRFPFLLHANFSAAGRERKKKKPSSEYFLVHTCLLKGERTARRNISAQGKQKAGKKSIAICERAAVCECVVCGAPHCKSSVSCREPAARHAQYYTSTMLIHNIVYIWVLGARVPLPPTRIASPIIVTIVIWATAHAIRRVHFVLPRSGQFQLCVSFVCVQELPGRSHPARANCPPPAAGRFHSSAPGKFHSSSKANAKHQTCSSFAYEMGWNLCSRVE